MTLQLTFASKIKGNTPFFRGINRGPAEAQSVSTRVKGIKSTSVKFTLLASVHAKTSAFVRRASQCLFSLFLYAVCSLRPSSHRSLGLPGALAWTADLIINPRSRRPSTKSKSTCYYIRSCTRLPIFKYTYTRTHARTHAHKYIRVI